ncbi:MAG: Holliday junction branch migration protein RuvA [Burkholderiaceae bacterium]
MIGRIAGTLLEKMPPHVLVDCGGVGYELDVPMSTLYNLPAVGERVALFAHLVVREDAQLLYGFGTHAERAAFRELIKIAGVGPRTALAVLSGLSLADLAQAITMQEPARLVQVPGIGKKTAERLLLELKGKLGADLGAPVGLSAIDAGDAAPDIMKALTSLGYSDKEALFAVKQVTAGSSVSDGIRQALKALSKS